MSDSISNLITTLVNAGAVRHDSVTVPASKLKQAILIVLKQEGFVGATEQKGNMLHITLAYTDAGPVINGAERVSKFSKRVYTGAKDIRRIKNGYGTVIMSTPKGIMTGQKAREENVGGEVLFNIW